MFTVQLKNGETVEVPLENLEEFLQKNREQIQVQQKMMRRPRKTKGKLFFAVSLHRHILHLLQPQTLLGLSLFLI